MSKHQDSKRTERSHDKSMALRISRKQKDFERYLVDRAMGRLIAEIQRGAKVGE